ncbi:MAG: hypothetical protein KAU17_15185, partial [Spirochaetales bacterium]|nr:hypothetical protein [Spirochaetales bacterium]
KGEQQVRSEVYMELVDIMRAEVMKIEAISDLMSSVNGCCLEERTVRVLGTIFLDSAAVLLEKLKELEVAGRRTNGIERNRERV